jgi:chain length determinant protein tyrosine kinase EpsG
VLESRIEHGRPPSQSREDLSIGRFLIESGKLNEEGVADVLDQQHSHYYLFGEIAKSMGLLSDQDIQAALDYQRGNGRLTDGMGALPAELVAARPSADQDASTFRELRLLLMQRWFSNGHKALAFVSVDEHIGTSFFVANLAVTFAQLNQKTLLIDANLRRPRQDKIFNVAADIGLIEMMSGLEHANFIPRPSVFRQLSVLKAGRTTPTTFELFGANRFPVIMRRLSSSFDITLVDLPSIHLGLDALTAAAQVGGAILVTRRNRTRVTEASAAEKKLKSLGVEVVGSVLIDL